MRKESRLASLDALRGFDMFWIMGGNFIIIEIGRISNSETLGWMALQMEHVEWNGFQFYDIIFPLFLFLAGVSLPFSLAKRESLGQPRRKVYSHLVQRTLLLIFFGLLTRGLLFRPWEDIGFYSVLGRIGLAWFFAALIVYHTRIRGQVIWFFGLLFAYWAMMKLAPVPGFGAGDLTLEGNLAGYFDRLIFPNHLNEGVFDSEGLLATIPAIATCLLGVFTGHLLRDQTMGISALKKGFILGIAGLLLLGAGSLWDLAFPINKKLWSSSFVFFAGGWSVILMAIFYLVIDVWQIRRWAFPFKVIGMNSITIYLTGFGIISFSSMRDFFFLNFIHSFPPGIQALAGAILYVLTAWVFLYLLYRNRIFLKV